MSAHHTAELLVNMVRRLAQYATDDPREDVRRGAGERLEAALEAVLGMNWTTAQQVAIIYAIRTAAAEGRDAASVIAQSPDLAGHEEKIGEAIAGCMGGKRIWPPLLELLRAINLGGGVTKPEHLHRKWREYEAGGLPAFFQPPGYKPPDP